MTMYKERGLFYMEKRQIDLCNYRLKEAYDSLQVAKDCLCTSVILAQVDKYLKSEFEKNAK